MNIVSIVIRARDCENDLTRCMKALEGQVLPDSTALEFVVVDNESRDGTGDVARAYGAQAINIPRSTFSWGRALNYGMKHAAGAYVILLSADAYPKDERFVANILSPLANEKVACVYGRQIPRADAPVEEIMRLGKYFDDTPRVFDSSMSSDLNGSGLIVSNACAAIRRSLWVEMNYDEDIEGGEEGIWTKQMIEKGYLSVYQPAAQVYHSHNDAVLRRACRTVELFLKNRKLKNLPINAFVFVRWMLHLIKSRLQTCATPGLKFTARVKGLAVLPVELVSNTIVFTVLSVQPHGRMRSLLWDAKINVISKWMDSRHRAWNKTNRCPQPIPE